MGSVSETVHPESTSGPDLVVVGLRPARKVDRHARPVVLRHGCRNLNLTAIVNIEADILCERRGHQSDVIVEATQRNCVSVYDLEIYCVLCLLDLLNSAF